MDEAKPFSNTAVWSSRSELLMRRFHHSKRLSKHLYWALLHYSLSPFKLLRCPFHPIPLTPFCHFHILSHSSHNLYKPCNYLFKGAQAGPIPCGKPVLRSTVPALCIVYSQKAQKHLTRALKRNSLNISSTSKMAPKFHVLVTEYITQIQARRRKEARGNTSTTRTLVLKENDEVDAEMV